MIHLSELRGWSWLKRALAETKLELSSRASCKTKFQGTEVRISSGIGDMDGEPILSTHGTAERGLNADGGTNTEAGEGANVGDMGTNAMTGNASAGSGENSFEVIPPQYE